MRTESNVFRISEVQRFCMHDGPGVRTTVFFAGCPLHCVWCHNPEAQSAENRMMLYKTKCIGCGKCAEICPAHSQIIGEERTIERTFCTACGRCAAICPAAALENSVREYTLEELTDIILKDRAFYAGGGGVTLSGGEPLASPNTALALLDELKKNGINTAIESCAYCERTTVEKAAALTDLFMWDYKLSNDEKHREYTGAPLDGIVSNIKYADSLGAKSVLRCIMLRGLNMNEVHYEGIARLFCSLDNCEYVELLPYHTYGDAKYEALGILNDPHREWIPDPAELEEAKTALEALGVKIKK